jgi:hypothetical protein
VAQVAVYWGCRLESLLAVANIDVRGRRKKEERGRKEGGRRRKEGREARINIPAGLVNLVMRNVLTRKT